MEWFRVYSEMLNDPKLDDFTDAQIGIWIKLLCLANLQTQRGYIEIKTIKKSAMYALAALLRTRTDRLGTALRLFSDRNMTTYDLEGKEGYVAITNWHKRQFKSDDVAKRVKNWRERNVTVTPQIEREGGNVSPSKTCPPPQYNGSDLERATQEATPSQSPNEIQHSQCYGEKQKNTFREDGESNYFGGGDMFYTAEKVSEKYDYPEAIDDVWEELAKGSDPLDIQRSMQHVLLFYEQKKAKTPRIAFRIEMASRIKVRANC